MILAGIFLLVASLCWCWDAPSIEDPRRRWVSWWTGWAVGFVGLVLVMAGQA